MNPEDRILRNPAVALAPSEDGYLAYDTGTDRLHRLNPAAALIVELCDGSHTAGDLVDEVAGLMAGDARDGCARWMEGAEADGLLTVVAPGGSIPTGPEPADFATLATRLRSSGHVLAAFVCQHYATQQLPDDADQWAALGELAHIVGRREETREAYERYLELEPGDAEVEHILVSLRDAPPPPRAPDECIVQLYARFAEFYEKNMVTDLEYQAPARVAEALDATLGPATDLDVLDLGCGTGLAGPHLRPRAKRLVGIDLSPEMVERAQATGFYDTLEVAEITEWLARPDGASFDLITACDTLIYFGDLLQVLRPMAARLRPGGTFAFTVEQTDEPAFRLTDSGRYVHSESHIRSAADAAGLRVERLEKICLRYEYGEAVSGLVAVLRRP